MGTLTELKRLLDSPAELMLAMIFRNVPGAVVNILAAAPMR